MTARPITRTWTVGELRAMGFDAFPADVPDCAEVEGTVSVDASDVPGRNPGIVFTFQPTRPIHYVTISGTISGTVTP